MNICHFIINFPLNLFVTGTQTETSKQFGHINQSCGILASSFCMADAFQPSQSSLSFCDQQTQSELIENVGMKITKWTCPSLKAATIEHGSAHVWPSYHAGSQSTQPTSYLLHYDQLLELPFQVGSVFCRRLFLGPALRRILVGEQVAAQTTLVQVIRRHIHPEIGLARVGCGGSGGQPEGLNGLARDGDCSGASLGGFWGFFGAVLPTWGQLMSISRPVCVAVEPAGVVGRAP